MKYLAASILVVSMVFVWIGGCTRDDNSVISQPDPKDLIPLACTRAVTANNVGELHNEVMQLVVDANYDPGHFDSVGGYLGFLEAKISQVLYERGYDGCMLNIGLGADVVAEISGWNRAGIAHVADMSFPDYDAVVDTMYAHGFIASDEQAELHAFYAYLSSTAKSGRKISSQGFADKATGSTNMDMFYAAFDSSAAFWSRESPFAPDKKPDILDAMFALYDASGGLVGTIVTGGNLIGGFIGLCAGSGAYFMSESSLEACLVDS